MAGDRGPAPDAVTGGGLLGRLAENPQSFDVFQALRRLEASRPDLPPIGTSRRVRDDAVRFGQPPSLRFAPCTIEEVRTEKDLPVPRVMVNHFGLLGPSGPLPLHMTELAYVRQLHHKDPTLARFLDVFNHRMIQLLYRAWAVNQITVSHQQASASGGARGEGHDPFAGYVGAFFGMSGRELRGSDHGHDMAKLFFAGRLACPTRNPEGLARLLKGYLGVDVRVEEFHGRWVDLPEQYRCRLGRDPATSTLGSATRDGVPAMCAAGTRMWDCQGAVRVVIGPLGLADYQRLLPVFRQGQPGGRSFQRVEAWCRHYFGDELDWDVQLELKKEQVPRTRLGGDAADPGAARLGWTSFSGSKPAASNARLVLGGRTTAVEAARAKRAGVSVVASV
jgi:type VI secretion system protein ImpH